MQHYTENRENKVRRRAQLAALHSLLDLLELPRESQIKSEAKLYGTLLVSSLIRSLVSKRVPKSLKRARRLGITVHHGENPPPVEKTLLANSRPQIERRRLMTIHEQDRIYDEYVRHARQGMDEAEIAKQLCMDLFKMQELVERRHQARRTAHVYKTGEPPEEV
jgi:hypothetical protein